VESPEEDDAAGGLMDEVPTLGIEAHRWTVVFHRRAENWFFSAIACGEFKHVSAFAFIPELGIWTIYDVGFRRTRLVHLADTDHAKTILAHIVKGNCTVTVEARDGGLPLMRAGLFCTTAIKHLIGARSSALRPSTLFRHLVAQGGVVRDDGIRETADRRGSEPGSRAGAGAAVVSR
jgi:hypothetical protein